MQPTDLNASIVRVVNESIQPKLSGYVTRRELTAMLESIIGGVHIALADVRLENGPGIARTTGSRARTPAKRGNRSSRTRTTTTHTVAAPAADSKIVALLQSHGGRMLSVDAKRQSRLGKRYTKELSRLVTAGTIAREGHARASSLVLRTANGAAASN
jgi:hypothetical protein